MPNFQQTLLLVQPHPTALLIHHLLLLLVLLQHHLIMPLTLLRLPVLLQPHLITLLTFLPLDPHQHQLIMQLNVLLLHPHHLVLLEVPLKLGVGFV